MILIHLVTISYLPVSSRVMLYLSAYQCSYVSFRSGSQVVEKPSYFAVAYVPLLGSWSFSVGESQEVEHDLPNHLIGGFLKPWPEMFSWKCWPASTQDWCRQVIMDGLPEPVGNEKAGSTV